MMNNIVRGIATLLVGVLLVVMNGGAIIFLVRLIGFAFLLPALVSAVNLLVGRKGRFSFQEVAVSVVDVGCIAFGIWLVFAPETFVELVVVLLALVILFYALFQLYKLFLAHKYVRVHWGYTVVPLSLVAVAVVALAVPGITLSFITVMIGISAIVSGLSDILISLLARRGGNLVKK